MVGVWILHSNFTILWCSMFSLEEVCFNQMLWRSRDILFLILTPGENLRAVVPAYSSRDPKHQLTEGSGSSTILISKKIDWRIETTKPPIVATCPYRRYRSSSIFLLNNFLYDVPPFFQWLWMPNMFSLSWIDCVTGIKHPSPQDLSR